MTSKAVKESGITLMRLKTEAFWSNIAVNGIPAKSQILWGINRGPH